MLEDGTGGVRPVGTESSAEAGVSVHHRSSHDGTLVDVLESRSASDPDRDGFIFLNYGGGGKTEERLTYANLLARAKAVAAALQAHAKRGDRVLILYPPGLDYIVAFFGTVLIGMVAVPVYPPRNAKHMDRLAPLEVAKTLD